MTAMTARTLRETLNTAVLFGTPAVFPPRTCSDFCRDLSEQVLGQNGSVFNRASGSGNACERHREQGVAVPPEDDVCIKRTRMVAVKT